MPTPTTTVAATKAAKPHKPLPAPNSDFYYLYETLRAQGQSDIEVVRNHRYPAANDYALIYIRRRSISIRPRGVVTQL